MAGVDPISLGIGGAAIGALTNKKDPLKGAVMGGALGYGGASLAAMGSTGTAAGAAGAVNPYATQAYASAVPGLTAAGEGSQAAMLAAQTGEFGAAGLANTANAATYAGAGGPLASGFWSGASKLAMGAPEGSSALRMGMAGSQLLSQKSQQTPSTQFRAGQAINSADPIAALLEPKRKKKEQFSLL